MLEAFAWGLWVVGSVFAFLVGTVVAMVAIIGVTIGIYALIVGTKQAIAERRGDK